MANRKELFFSYFGPKVIEAIVLIMKDEINLLRVQHELPERTNQQIIDAISNKLVELSDYIGDS